MRRDASKTLSRVMQLQWYLLHFSGRRYATRRWITYTHLHLAFLRHPHLSWMCAYIPTWVFINCSNVHIAVSLCFSNFDHRYILCKFITPANLGTKSQSCRNTVLESNTIFIGYQKLSEGLFKSRLNSNLYHYRLKFILTSKHRYNSKFQVFGIVRILKIQKWPYLGQKNFLESFIMKNQQKRRI